MGHLWQDLIKTIKTPAVWGALVWTLVVGVAVLMVAFLVLGLSEMTVVGRLASSPAMGAAYGAGTMVAFVGFGFIGAIIVLPFVVGGVMGSIAQVLRNEPAPFTAFWNNGIRCYGRGWGLLLYDCMVAVAVSIVGGIFTFLSPLVGVLIGILCGVALVPFTLRFLGGLFIQQRRWGDAFRHAWVTHRESYLRAIGVVMVPGVLLILYDVLVTFLVRHAPLFGFLEVISIVAALGLMVWQAVVANDLISE